MGEHILRVLGVAGSLRRSSRKPGLIRAATEPAPTNVTIEAFVLNLILLSNGNAEEADVPASARGLAQRIRTLSAALVANPEYNYGIPGVLKNAVDWVSRPRRQARSSTS